jgi:hypothetical protein
MRFHRIEPELLHEWRVTYHLGYGTAEKYNFRLLLRRDESVKVYVVDSKQGSARDYCKHGN